MTKERTMLSILLLPLYVIVTILVLVGVTALYDVYSAIYKEIITMLSFAIATYIFPIGGWFTVGNFVANCLLDKAKQNQKK